MGQYGDCAVLAVALIVENRVKDPCKGWECAGSQKIKSDSSQQKGCPKDVFLGLCEEGLVKGVAKGNYTGSVDNKDYAVKAVEILSRTIRPGNKITVKKTNLWRQITDNKISQNGQLDVVFSLWEEGLINKR